MTNPVNEVILHVGLPKTGTTSIQDSLFHYHNNKMLESLGYLYPKCWTQNHSFPIYREFGDQIGIYEFFTHQKEFIINHYMSDPDYKYMLKKCIDETPHSKLIISAEGIPDLSVDNLRSLRRYFESLYLESITIKIIMYIRNPLNWIESYISETIKHNWVKKDSIIFFKERISHYFKDTINKFESVFGMQFVNVYSFEESIKHQYGIVGHFLTTINMKEDNLSKFLYIKANSRFPQILLDFISFVNESSSIFKDGYLYKNLRYFEGFRGGDFHLTNEEKVDFLNLLNSDLEWLYNHYGFNYINCYLNSINVSETYFNQDSFHDFKVLYAVAPAELRVLIKKFFINLHEKISCSEEKSLIEGFLNTSNEYDAFIFNVNYSKEYYNEDFVVNFKKNYSFINNDVKFMAITYLQHLIDFGSVANKPFLVNLLHDLRILNHYIANNDSDARILLNMFNDSFNVQPDEFYREVALYMVFHGQMNLAKNLLVEASKTSNVFNSEIYRRLNSIYKFLDTL